MCARSESEVSAGRLSQARPLRTPRSRGRNGRSAPKSVGDFISGRVRSLPPGATLAQPTCTIAHPKRHVGRGAFQWGWTACDGPTPSPISRLAHLGAPAPENDDGSHVPTAVADRIP